MNAIVLLSIVILSLGAVYIQYSSSDTIRGVSDTAQDTIAPQPTQSPTSINTPSTPTPSITVLPQDDYTHTPSAINTFIYPGSVIISQTGSVIRIKSNDEADAITDWYRLVIKNNGMNTTSFVTTTTNGSVLNKLAGAKSGDEIQITITKEPDSTTTTIVIEQ